MKTIKKDQKTIGKTLISRDPGFGLFKVLVPDGRIGLLKKGRCRSYTIKPKWWQKLFLGKKPIFLDKFEHGVSFNGGEVEWFLEDECEMFVE